ncbi:methyl-accepting chemotaxis protein [Ammoniphilus sp. CFH 90114]|uniref:methyl-accepting chemotaxis protein n=1 Tax=Ammoniphilus sp. CFH 90114 TaxID=2493665 RepID=UPI00100EFA58|nr:methyl-accepting chemotaxis protein [Ammoniphilus sp. CFH 90114]RXT06518.1 methyl-accepting chemotaxis protein [Ammoniphilus sp. CFH 90114]
MKSMKTKILILVSSLLLSSLLLLAGVNHYNSARILEEQLRQESSLEATNVAVELEKFLYTKQSVMDTLAATASTYYGDNEKVLAFIKQAQSQLSFLTAIIYSPDLLGANSFTHQGNAVDISSRPFIKDLSAGKSIISDPVVSKADGSLAVIIGAPIVKDGKTVAHLTASINLEEATKLLSTVKVRETGYATLLDTQGTIIYHPDSELIMKKNIEEFGVEELTNSFQQAKEGVNTFTNYELEDGIERFGSFVLTQNGWVVLVTAPIQELYLPLNNLTKANVVIVLLMILVGMAISYLLASYLIRPIVTLRAAVQDVASGNLTKEVHIQGRDELAQLASDFNRMTQNLKELVIRVGNSVEGVNDSTIKLVEQSDLNRQSMEEITHAVRMVAAGSDEQFSKSYDAEQVVNEISKGIDQVAHSIQTVADQTVTASQQVANGNHVVKGTIDHMKLVYEKVEVTSQIINHLGSKSKEISQIVSLITDIANQTNLLALNAAIEAARAGEHGRGFAVVADEVRKLAEQSGQSAGKINTLIQDIQQEAMSAVGSMSEGSVAMKEGMEQVHQTGEAFQVIARVVEEVASQSQEVSAIVEEVNASMASMLEMMNGISQISEQAKVASEQVATTTENQVETMNEVWLAVNHLQQLSTELQEGIKKFKA